MTDHIEELFQQVMHENCKDPLRRFAELVAAYEREACAKLCECLHNCEPEPRPDDCAEAIRARGDMSTKQQNVDTFAERVHESDKSIHDFKPDWDMIQPFHERIKELEIENERLRQALAQPEQEPVAWVRDLTSPSTHCVTSLKYLSIADTDAGVKYIPVYTAPPSKPDVNHKLVEALELAVRQNSHDMVLTGEELRICEAILAKHKEQA